MKRNPKDQPIIQRPKPISLIVGMAATNYPDNDSNRNIYIKGALAMQEIINNRTEQNSLSQTRIQDLEKEVERLNKLYLDLLDIAHKQAGCKNCIDELQLQSIKNNPPNE